MEDKDSKVILMVIVVKMEKNGLCSTSIDVCRISCDFYFQISNYLIPQYPHQRSSSFYSFFVCGYDGT